MEFLKIENQMFSSFNDGEENSSLLINDIENEFQKTTTTTSSLSLQKSKKKNDSKINFNNNM